MRMLIVLATLLTSFLSLMGIIVAAKTSGFSPEQFRDPSAAFQPTTVFTILAILLFPIFIVCLVQKKIHKKSLFELGVKSDWPKLFMIGLGLGAFAKVIALIIAFNYSDQPSYAFNLVDVNVSEWIPYFAWFLVTLFLNSFSEEFVYRAYPIENLSEAKFLTLPMIVVISALIFSLMHFLIEPVDLWMFLYRFFFGITAGLLFTAQRNIWGIVGLHTGWNFIARSFSDAAWQSSKGYPLTL